jgi:glycosyltransferase involved in cell wall biosynthesis
MAKAAPASVMKYNWSSTARRLLKVYQELSSKHGA